MAIATIRYRRGALANPTLPESPSPTELVDFLCQLRGEADGQPHYSLRDLPSPDQLLGLADGCEIIHRHIAQGSRLLIVGDFDADGATSTALLMLGLRAMGAMQVDYIVPSRHAHGYGLSATLVEVIQQSRRADLLITVDNGIASIAGVAAAREAGYEVIITDHHLPGNTLPDAAAIINPNQPNCPFPDKHIAGVGVAFYLLIGLRQRLQQRGWFEQRGIAPPNLATWLDLVAIGTICDVVKLDGVNRTLVDQGLRRIRAGQCCPGILALLNDSSKPLRLLNATDIGYGIGPKINAAGRLDDMSIGIRCLLADNQTAAQAMVKQLTELNQQRKALQADTTHAALESLDIAADDLQQKVICLFDDNWHSGVVGLVAGHLKNTYHRPCIIFGAGEAGMIKGSARSVGGCHIRDFLDAVDRHHPDLIERFGGHAMAAGLSLRPENFSAFQQACADTANTWLADFSPENILTVDTALPAASLSLPHALAIRQAGPWGNGFEPPLFEGTFSVEEIRIVGNGHFKFRLQPADGLAASIDAIAFFPESDEPLPGATIQCLYQLEVNAWAGKLSPQLIIERFWQTTITD